MPLHNRSEVDGTAPLRFGLFDNYDSQPQEDFSKNDYGWSTAFGFKFRGRRPGNRRFRPKKVSRGGDIPRRTRAKRASVVVWPLHLRLDAC